MRLKNRYLGRFSVHFVMSREPQHTHLLNGRIDAAKVAALAREISDIGAADEYFVCGPGGMVGEVRDAVRSLNGSAPVRIERFATAPDADARWMRARAMRVSSGPEERVRRACCAAKKCSPRSP